MSKKNFVPNTGDNGPHRYGERSVTLVHSTEGTEKGTLFYPSWAAVALIEAGSRTLSYMEWKLLGWRLDNDD